MKTYGIISLYICLFLGVIFLIKHDVDIFNIEYFVQKKVFQAKKHNIIYEKINKKDYCQALLLHQKYSDRLGHMNSVEYNLRCYILLMNSMFDEALRFKQKDREYMLERQPKVRGYYLNTFSNNYCRTFVEDTYIYRQMNDLKNGENSMEKAIDTFDFKNTNSFLGDLILGEIYYLEAYGSTNKNVLDSKKRLEANMIQNTYSKAVLLLLNNSDKDDNLRNQWEILQIDRLNHFITNLTCLPPVITPYSTREEQ